MGRVQALRRLEWVLIFQAVAVMAILLSPPRVGAETGVVVNTKKLIVRERPTKRAPVVTELLEGDEVEILSIKGRAVKIQTSDGDIGWVPAKYLEITEDGGNRGEGGDSSDVTMDLSPGGEAQERPKVYIVPIQVEGVEPELGAAVQGAVYEGFEKRKLYKFMTKADVERELGKGGAVQFFGCGTNVACLSRFAHDLGAEKIYTGKLYRLGDALMFKLNEIDPGIGAINNSASQELDEEGDVFKGVDDVLTKLLGVGPDGAKVMDLSADLSVDLSEGDTGSETAPQEGTEAGEEAGEEQIPDPDKVVTVKKKVEDRGSGISQAWAWITLGAGLGLAGAGTAFYVMADKNADNYESTPFQRNNPRYHESLQDTINRQALLGNILLPVGAVVAASSSVLFWLAFSGNNGDEEEGIQKLREWSMFGGAVKSIGLFVEPGPGRGVVFGVRAGLVR